MAKKNTAIHLIGFFPKVNAKNITHHSGFKALHFDWVFPHQNTTVVYIRKQKKYTMNVAEVVKAIFI